MPQYKALKPISTPNGSVKVGEVTNQVGELPNAHGELKLYWPGISHFMDIAQAIKDGVIEIAVPIEYNDNGSLKHWRKELHNQKYFVVTSSFSVAYYPGSTWDMNKFNFITQNYFDTEQAAHKYCDTLKKRADGDYVEPEKPKVTRIEVIDDRGRNYSNYNIKNYQLDYQDNGKTLKIFIK